MLTSKRPTRRLGATVQGPRPGGCLPLGSAHSRAAARAALVARRVSEMRFQCCSIIDGKPLNFDGLAERIRAARKEQDRTWKLEYDS